MSMPKKNTYRNQRGVSLVELLIAMTIGLVLMLALSYFFLSSRQTSRTHDDVSRMQENARYALDTMGKAIRQAGYRADTNQPYSGTVISGTDGTTDTITLGYSAQAGGERDCAGTSVSSGNMAFIFSINSSLELTCSNGASTALVAENIENMQITYGIDDTRNGSIDGTSYPSAASITSSDWPKVAVVSVVLTMRGSTKGAATGGDGYLRQTYYGSFTVRNQAG